MSVSWVYWPSNPVWTDAEDTWDGRPQWIRPARPGTMRWSAQRQAEPDQETLDLATVKIHLKVDTVDDDALISNLILSARDEAERRTGMSLLTQTWKLFLDRWPRMGRMEYWPSPGIPFGSILLPSWPVQSVASVVWLGIDATTNTVPTTDYVVDLASRPARISPGYLKTWPTSTSLVPNNGIVVTFTSGYTTTFGVPPGIKQAMLLLIGHWYEHREEVVIEQRAVRTLQMPYAAEVLFSRYTPPLVG